jgi:hypothetical protein
LEKSTLRRLTQRPSPVQLWHTPAGTAPPNFVPPPQLPEVAQEASYFAAPARRAIFAPKSIRILYTRIGMIASPLSGIIIF